MCDERSNGAEAETPPVPRQMEERERGEVAVLWNGRNDGGWWPAKVWGGSGQRARAASSWSSAVANVRMNLESQQWGCWRGNRSAGVGRVAQGPCSGVTTAGLCVSCTSRTQIFHLKKASAFLCSNFQSPTSGCPLSETRLEAAPVKRGSQCIQAGKSGTTGHLAPLLFEFPKQALGADVNLAAIHGPVHCVT